MNGKDEDSFYPDGDNGFPLNQDPESWSRWRFHDQKIKNPQLINNLDFLIKDYKNYLDPWISKLQKKPTAL